MTLAEVVIFIVLALALCLLFSPLQKRLETRLYRFFRESRPSQRGGRIIDVTDSIKKKDKDNG
jgi:membrane protein implicated in regulation of membrane protease activity